MTLKELREEILRNRRHRIERRLDPKRRWSEQPAPMLGASNIHFEMAERDRVGQLRWHRCYPSDGSAAGLS
jgi:hypothetical protein